MQIEKEGIIADFVKSAIIEPISGYLVPVVHLTESTEWAINEVQESLLEKYTFPIYVFVVVAVQKRQWVHYHLASDGKYDVAKLAKDFNCTGEGTRERASLKLPRV